MIYTSGTRDIPKGAWRPNGVNIANVLQVISIFELNQSMCTECGPVITAPFRFSPRCIKCSARRS